MERKDLRESSTETDSSAAAAVSQTSSLDESENADAQDSPQSKKRKSLKKRSSKSRLVPNVPKAVLSNAKSPLKEIQPSSPRSPQRNSNPAPRDVVQSPARNEKRFFKSRTPTADKTKGSNSSSAKKKNGTPNSGKKATPSAVSKMTMRGLKMTYKPASLKNKTTPTSPDIRMIKRLVATPPLRRSPRKTAPPQLIGLGENVQLVDTLVESGDSAGPDSSRDDMDVAASPVRRRSPRKQPRPRSPASSLQSEDLFPSTSGSQELWDAHAPGREEPSTQRNDEEQPSSANHSFELFSEMKDSTPSKMRTPAQRRRRRCGSHTVPRTS